MSELAPRAVFVHGAGGGRASWARQESRLDGSVVLALPGHPLGASFDNVGDAATWVADELAAVPGPRVLVGHSLGGMIAMEVALRRPELVDGLVLIATGARISVPAEVFAETERDFDARCEAFSRRCLAVPTDDAVERTAAVMRECGVENVLRDYRAVDGWDGRERLGELRMPTLVVAAVADRITPPSMSEELARGLPNALSAIVADAGHLPMSEQPEAVNLLLAAFLARLEVTLIDR